MTEGGATHEVMEETITGLEVAGKQELLPITKLLASLVFTSEAEKEWLTWRFSKMHDILHDTWAYQEMIKEGREEGKRETLRDMLLTIVQARFPELVLLAKGLAAVIENPDVLRDLILKMSLVQTSEEAQAALVEVSKENSN